MKRFGIWFVLLLIGLALLPCMSCAEEAAQAGESAAPAGHAPDASVGADGVIQIDLTASGRDWDNDPLEFDFSLYAEDMQTSIPIDFSAFGEGDLFIQYSEDGSKWRILFDPDGSNEQTCEVIGDEDGETASACHLLINAGDVNGEAVWHGVFAAPG